MSAPTTVQTTLSASEWRLICRLRELSTEPRGACVRQVVDELVDFAAFPRCARMQADGVPCQTATVSCDDCRQVDFLLEAVRARLFAA